MNAKTTQVIYPNFDFEYELSSSLQPWKRRERFEPIIQRWKHVLRLIPDFEDACVVSTIEEAQQLRKQHPLGHMEMTCWGKTRSAQLIAEALQARFASPPTDILRTVNSKVFSHQFERTHCIALPGATLVDNFDELRQAIDGLSELSQSFSKNTDWLLKHPFGVSGRERVSGCSHAFANPTAQNWAKQAWDEGFSLIFEPRIPLKGEVSIQFELGAKGVSLVGIAELLTDRTGAFRGHRVSGDLKEQHRLAEKVAQGRGMIQWAERAAHKTGERGYCGPLGIDAFWGQWGERELTRPITELNARTTFGRLALELGRWVPPHWSYTWWHPSPKRMKALHQFVENSSIKPEARWPTVATHICEPGLYRLPHFAEPPATPQTCVLIAPDLHTLKNLESVWIAAQ